MGSSQYEYVELIYGKKIFFQFVHWDLILWQLVALKFIHTRRCGRWHLGHFFPSLWQSYLVPVQKQKKCFLFYMLYHIKLGSVQKIFVYVGIEKEIYITSLKHFG